MPIQNVKNYGFSNPVIKTDQYIFGAEMVPKVVLRTDGQWIDYLPDNEKQFNLYFDTYGCTVFGTLNAEEMLERRVLGKNVNNSDRFTYISSETRPPGNDPHVVAESIRNAGVIEESQLPFSEDVTTIEMFANMGTDGPKFIADGVEWVKSHKFMHEWIITNVTQSSDKPAILIECLTYSPIGLSVRAWQQRENGLFYKNPGEDDTHWCVCVGYKLNEYWIIYDSYPQTDGEYIKLLEWNFDFGFAKRYHLELRPVLEQPVAKMSFFKKLWIMILDVIRSVVQ